MRSEMECNVAAMYKSASQRARVITELWGENNLYCANCTSPTLTRCPPNTQATDFVCPECLSPFQLKSQASKFSRRIVDAGYEAMRRAVVENRVPNLIALHYDATNWRIMNAILVPRFAFSMSLVEKRPPLSLTARRAGWVGCNILLCNIPDDAKIVLVREGVPSTPHAVRRKYRLLKPLVSLNPELRGWTLDVLRIARSLKTGLFSLEDVYAHENQLRDLHPSNRHIRPKIRQQLQRLRDLNIIEFVGGGKYCFRNLNTDA